jgi:hypothetical protein
MTKIASLIVLSLLMVACGTKPVSVTQKFPDAPPELLKKCEQLKQVETGKVAITDLLKTVVENYALYYECSNRVDGWHDWHRVQKDVFDSVKK